MALLETREVLKEAVKVFQSNDDLETISHVKKAFQERNKEFDMFKADARTCIQELTRKIDEESSKAIPKLPDAEHQRRLDELENDKFLVAKRCNTLDQGVHDLEVKIQQMKVSIRKMQEEKQHMQVEQTVEVPKIKHALSLYASISRIKWDYEADDLVKGYMTRDKSDAVRPFSVNPKDFSAFFLTNHLWELM